MRAVAFSTALALAATGFAVAEEPKPAFNVRSPYPQLLAASDSRVAHGAQSAFP